MPIAFQFSNTFDSEIDFIRKGSVIFDKIKSSISEKYGPHINFTSETNYQTYKWELYGKSIYVSKQNPERRINVSYVF